MRSSRITFWIISLIVCAVIILYCKKEEAKVPYEERTPLNVYCVEQFQESVKKIIEQSSLGDDHRVVFVDSKEDAEFILTDRIIVADKEYKRLGWTPLIVAFDDTTKDNLKSYEEAGYLTKVESEDAYEIDFEKVIEDTLEGKWKHKIYCPKSNTREGELFFDFLLVNVNNGVYPKNEKEMEECTQVVNEFMNNSNVVQLDSVERLKNRKVVKNELYVLLEKDLYDMIYDYEYGVSYPTNTVVYEYHYHCQGKNAKELERAVLKDNGIFDNDTKIESIMYDYYMRYDERTGCPASNSLEVTDGFSYAEIPLKEE